MNDKKIIKPTRSIEVTVDHKKVMDSMTEEERKKSIEDLGKFFESETNKQLKAALSMPPYPYFQRVNTHEEETIVYPLWFRLM